MMTPSRVSTAAFLLVRLHVGRFLIEPPRISSSLHTTRRSSSSGLSLSHPSVQKFMEKIKVEESSAQTQLARLVSSIIQKQAEIRELTHLGAENADLREIAEDDARNAKTSLSRLEDEFFRLVLEPEQLDYCDETILEVSAGVGGQEAMLFSREVFDMYANYAEFKGWHAEVLQMDETELGGMRHGSLAISGPECYKTLKFEGGVHRVQRVPKTEKSGRTHTSTSTVAIMPTPAEIDVDINPQDLRVETKRASGAGGQHVNKTESAVRITHIPSGIAVECQTDRSQIKNKSNAMKTLRARLYQVESDKQVAKTQSSRKLQVGLGGRSEKIRTYNFVQDRVTDHRIALSVYNLRGVLQGYEHLDHVVQLILDFHRQERLLEMFK